MKISTFFYTLWQGVRSLFRNGWYSLASIATISACLFLFGTFFAVVYNVQNILYKAEEAVSVTVFFNEDVADTRIEEIGQQIALRAEVSSLTFHDDDEIWAEFGPAYFGEDYAEGFPENPLAGENNYEVFLSDVSKQDVLVGWLKSLPEVRKVNFSEVTANTLTGMNKLIAYVSIAIIAILLAVSIFLISNTVRVGISVRSEEISIMKYIGATDAFIRTPFIIEGSLLGITGSIISVLVIRNLYYYIAGILANYMSLISLGGSIAEPRYVITKVCIYYIIYGIGLGAIGSMFSVRKFLKV